MHDVDEIALRFHHSADIFVRAGRLIEHITVFATLDAFGNSRRPARTGRSAARSRATSRPDWGKFLAAKRDHTRHALVSE
jgi:hypothetical protein